MAYINRTEEKQKMTKESEVEKTARFTRHFLQGIVLFFIIIVIIAGVGAFWFWHQDQTVKNAVPSSTPTPPPYGVILTPTPTSTTTPTSSPTPTNGTNLVGLNVGDTFTYKLTGDSVLFSSDATTPAYLSEYNNTEYFQVTVTGINGSIVTVNTIWQFTNGTAIQNSNWVNLETGNYSGEFWAIYPSNLNANDFLYPNGNAGLIVNSTNTQTNGYAGLTVNSTSIQTYTDSARATNYWSTSHTIASINAPSNGTELYTYLQVYFDKQTGMLTSLTNIQEYNNPEYNILITWQLTSTNVWTV